MLWIPFHLAPHFQNLCQPMLHMEAQIGMDPSVYIQGARDSAGPTLLLTSMLLWATAHTDLYLHTTHGSAWDLAQTPAKMCGAGRNEGNPQARGTICPIKQISCGIQLHPCKCRENMLIFFLNAKICRVLCTLLMFLNARNRTQKQRAYCKELQC